MPHARRNRCAGPATAWCAVAEPEPKQFGGDIRFAAEAADSRSGQSPPSICRISHRIQRNVVKTHERSGETTGSQDPCPPRSCDLQRVSSFVARIRERTKPAGSRQFDRSLPSQARSTTSPRRTRKSTHAAQTDLPDRNLTQSEFASRKRFASIGEALNTFNTCRVAVRDSQNLNHACGHFAISAPLVKNENCDDHC